MLSLSRAVAAFALVMGLAMPATAQLPGTTDSPPRRGGFTPFRDRGFAGTTFDAVSLIQEDCPAQLVVTSIQRNDRGSVVVSLRFTNVASGEIARHTLLAWSIARDGTIRGRRQWTVKRAVAAGKDRQSDFSLAAVPVQPGDVVVVAVQETTGGAPWRRGVQELEDEVRASIVGP